MISRKSTRQVDVGGVKIGGGAPVALQTMTSGHTHEIDKCIAEVQKLAKAGADLVRVAVVDKRDDGVLPASRSLTLDRSFRRIDASPLVVLWRTQTRTTCAGDG